MKSSCCQVNPAEQLNREVPATPDCPALAPPGRTEPLRVVMGIGQDMGTAGFRQACQGDLQQVGGGILPAGGQWRCT